MINNFFTNIINEIIEAQKLMHNNHKSGPKPLSNSLIIIVIILLSIISAFILCYLVLHYRGII